ncbi:hypothetical protein BD324DRAFT_622133 [Kockovaella imperatae]|uniref:VASt domain-containing protein n=1 Tax=Kockovaella imperatae TaxID=4999 RepID=A0A1Y1UKZ4_9TREE|nr:hypothetical protein BD324DRAFT_622133 [Kockovaella imperatae]ORX38733.1 hypothetical protein BD324DRAFT_622133 [Kockovaella imperatae]
MNRPREVSVGSIDSQVSLESNDSNPGVRRKRQSDFERIFGSQVGQDVEVLATQSCDWQSNILLHGRLYLTRTHLCFRSNILGYVTEHVHPLADVVALERGTTAKWIQNAVYVNIKDESDPDGIHFGYGSLKDRDAMYETIFENWKAVAPDRVEAMQTRRKEAASMMGSSESNETGAAGVVRSEGTGECYAELAIDTQFPIPLEELYKLLYHNDEFIHDFMTNDKKLTDVNIDPWKDEPKKRTMSYVMHMSGMGPSESDCYSTETVAVADPKTSYEIVSETRTPGVPSGKRFVIRTRTVLTHAEVHHKPGSRMYVTTECDWSSSSWLKGTITPAVIKGQRSHHEQLAKKVNEWIKSHDMADVVVEVSTPALTEPTETAPWLDLEKHVSEILGNPVMIALIAVLLAIIILQRS